MGRNKFKFCEWCEKEIRSDKFNKHFNYCFSKDRSNKCPLCLKFISKKNISKHLSKCKNNIEGKCFLELKNYGKMRCECGRYVTEDEFIECLKKNHTSSIKIETRSEEIEKINRLQNNLDKGESKIYFIHESLKEDEENSFEQEIKRLKSKYNDL